MSSAQMRKLMLLMEAPIHLDPNLVPSQLRAGYNGKKFKAEVTTQVTIPIDAGLYSGGSRDTYHIVRLADGSSLPAIDHAASPFVGTRREEVVRVEPGFVVVRHTMFHGKDLGLTFYVNPADAEALLPAPGGEVSDVEKKVLNIIGGIRSGYRDDERRRAGISAQDYEAAKQSLFAKGLIDKRGAITVAGRNNR